MKLVRLIILIFIAMSTLKAEINMPSNKCALVVYESSSKENVKRYINDHYYQAQKRYINIYLTYDDKYALSLGFLNKDKINKQVSYLKNNKGYYIPHNYVCMASDDLKKEIPVLEILADQAKLKYGNGASFDCNYASGDVENKICKDSVLSTLDKINAFIYDNLKALFRRNGKYSDLTRLQKHESNWVKYRNKKCDNEGYSCIRDEYLNHIKFLYNKGKSKESLYFTESEANLDSYIGRDNTRSYSIKNTSNNYVERKVRQNHSTRNGNCSTIAAGMCLALQYGCNKEAENLSREKRYALEMGCNYISNGKSMNQEQMMESVIGSYVSEQADKEDGFIGFLFKVADLSLKVNSWATCVNNTTRYLKKNQLCKYYK